MKAQIIQIGNSQGIRIPKLLLEESKVSGEVELELHKDGILIKSTRSPRHGWEESFRVMADNDDGDVLSGAANSFDRKEWQW